MTTTSRTSRIAPAAALLLGCALAVTPITASAGETDASQQHVGSVRSVPNLRQQLEADRGKVPSAPRPNLRQQMEADGGAAPSGPRPDLRQRIQGDRTPEPVPMPTVVPDDTDPREHRKLSARSEAPDVYVHLRILALG